MFYSTMTSYLSKDQGNIGFSVHDPFHSKYILWNLLKSYTGDLSAVQHRYKQFHKQSNSEIL